MSASEDIARIVAQEQRLQFETFNADLALEIGLAIKERVAARGQAVTIDIRLWDRQLFSFAMAGTTNDNAEWVRRKTNLVRRFHRSSYRMLLERGGEEVMKPHWGLGFDEYVFAGGGFPINIKGVGCIGVITVSGLPGRDDHGLVVETLCALLGADYAGLALPPA